MDHFVVEYCVVILGGACEHMKMMLRGWADDGGGAKDGWALLMSQCVCKGPAQDDFHWWTAVPIIPLCSQTQTFPRGEDKRLLSLSATRQTQKTPFTIKPRQLFGNFLISSRFPASICRYIFVETCCFFLCFKSGDFPRGRSVCPFKSF